MLRPRYGFGAQALRFLGCRFATYQRVPQLAEMRFSCLDTLRAADLRRLETSSTAATGSLNNWLERCRDQLDID